METSQMERDLVQQKNLEYEAMIEKYSMKKKM